METTSKVAVVYIARKSNAGLIALVRFLESAKKNNPGMEYDLIVIVKGWGNCAIENERIRVLASEFKAELKFLPDDGFDWGAYFRIAEMLDHEFICFFNSHSKILSQNWLKYLYNGLRAKNVGAAGATGSFSSWSFSLPYLNKNFKSYVLYPFRVLKSIWESLQHAKDSSPFPSTHIRSNAFITNRKIFLEYRSLNKIPKNKKHAHALESGIYSYTAFLAKKKLEVVVVGRDGNIYFSKDWTQSQTFRVPVQLNLLVSDNQTNNYQLASVEQKRRLEWSAWRRIFS